MTIEYLRDVYPSATFLRRDVPRHGGLAPGQDQDGYGRKISTDYMVQHLGRQYRVYCTQISNAGSCWITIRGRRLHIGDFDIPDHVRHSRSEA